jgi:Na+-driven multidrug efflux pump
VIVPSFLLAFGDVLDACQPVSELVSSSCNGNTPHTDVHCEVGEQMSPMRGPAVKYLALRAFGAPALVISFAVQGIFRGFKDTRIALSASLAGSLINILLEPILMFTFHFGVSGAAVATVASQ